MSVIIRPATNQDFSQVLFLIKEFSHFQKCPEKVSITLEQLNDDENLFRCLVAESEEKKIVGFATFFFAYYSWSGKAIYLDDLYVTEQARKNGIGKLLLDAVITFAKANNCKKVRWQVSKWNKNAIGFYRKIGAEVDDVEINCDLRI